ncbi:hypothetical protein BJ165DRAFT_771728 [Panaeolus papilionaceus]|nr:hypothetical protein BJ165DRAFT_771728 [Panaeolus papilionaceus]
MFSDRCVFQFIEAFAGVSQKLSISKDQLAGYTQTITAYRLVNVMYTHWHYPRPVYLIDTPGFSDSKISEMEILNMIRKWSQDNSYLNYSRRLLYFMPITETRLPGSRRRTFEMFKNMFEGHKSLASLTVITTMWDTVHNERTQNRAQSKFAQLREETLTVNVEMFLSSLLSFLLSLYRYLFKIQALTSSNL